MGKVSSCHLWVERCRCWGRLRGHQLPPFESWSVPPIGRRFFFHANVLEFTSPESCRNKTKILEINITPPKTNEYLLKINGSYGCISYWNGPIFWGTNHLGCKFGDISILQSSGRLSWKGWRLGSFREVEVTSHKETMEKEQTYSSRDSWMYPYQRTPMGNPYISPI